MGFSLRIMAAGWVLTGAVTARVASAQNPAPAAQVAPPAEASPAQPAAPAKKQRDPVEKLSLETSDGIALAAWHYRAAGEAERPPVVILLHDLNGSHLTVEPLAKELARRGIAVVAPDLRGHGASTARQTAGGEETIEARSLKKPDFEAMTLTQGGRVRDQSAMRGDIECVRNWIKLRADEGKLDIDRLFVAGSGLGCTLAAMWAINDASWPDLVAGPQGRQVRGLVFISPTWSSRSLTVSPVLAADLIRRELPVMVLAGRDDRDAVKLFDQLKRQRPNEWFEQRAGQAAPTKATKLEGSPTLYLLQRDSDLSGDQLASMRSPDPRRAGGDPAALIQGFVNAVAPPADDE
jgi:pimeloyl-ACP methyl ester carboxylesterase